MLKSGDMLNWRCKSTVQDRKMSYQTKKSSNNKRNDEKGTKSYIEQTQETGINPEETKSTRVRLKDVNKYNGH